MAVSAIPRLITCLSATVLFFLLVPATGSCGAFHAGQLFAVPPILPSIDSKKSENQPRNAIMPTLAWAAVEQVLNERSFVSGDELFQLLYLLYSRDRQLRFRLEKEQLSRLAVRIKTLFPLAACTAVEVDDGRLIFTFEDDQKIAVPNTWRQTSLAVAKRLVLRIVEDEKLPAQSFDPAEDDADPDNKAIGFSLEEGYVRLHFSFLIKLLGGKLRDAEGGKLVYRLNERTKISRLELVELIPLAGADLQAVGNTMDRHGRDTVWIDIRHGDFPETKDIGITDHRIVFLGTAIELLPGNRLRIGDQEPMENAKAWTWFAENIELFRRYADKAGQPGVAIDYTRNFGYHFEERRIVMNLGFQGADGPVTK